MREGLGGIGATSTLSFCFVVPHHSYKSSLTFVLLGHSLVILTPLATLARLLSSRSPSV